jgi:hypothetical protein
MAKTTDEYTKMLQEQEGDMKKNPEKYFSGSSELRSNRMKIYNFTLKHLVK